MWSHSFELQLSEIQGKGNPEKFPLTTLELDPNTDVTKNY
jgi:hypothetical protein